MAASRSSGSVACVHFCAKPSASCVGACDVFPLIKASSAAEVVPLYSGKENLDGVPLTSTALGGELARSTNGTSRIKEAITAFWFGRKFTLNPSLRVPGVTFASTLNEHRINRKGAPLTLADLPEDFRKSTEDARRQALQEQSAPPIATPAKP